MKRPPTDRELLKKIYDRYYAEFIAYDEENKNRSSKNYVPIDCEKIAKELKIDMDIVFGRLYYHLNKKYGYTQEDGGKVHLFAMRVGGDIHVVHYPLLSAVLAELEQSSYRFILPIIISAIALIFSICGILWNIT